MIISMMMSRTQSTVIMAIETEMFRLLFLCHGKGVNLMELSMREKELLIMFGSERRLDTHKRLQNAIPYMTDSLYKASATALWNNYYWCMWFILESDAM